MSDSIDTKCSPSYDAMSGLGCFSSEDSGAIKDDTKLIAFYLPQFHRIPENDEWWGPGFTEWTNVAKAKPNFEGHYQPHVPRDLGFYDLSNPGVLREQAEYARLYGVHGFCFHYYWFSGRRILESPVEAFLKSDISLNFCYCWANENWTRTWDGDSKSVLLEQQYQDGDEERFIDSLIEAFNDPRYIRVDNKPLLIIYCIKALPNPSKSVQKWRDEAMRQGFDGLHIVAVDFYDISRPDEVGVDALVEFPPHKFNGPQNHPDVLPAKFIDGFKGGLLDYRKVAMQSILREKKDFLFYRSIIPSWDNTARRQTTPTILVNATPKLYGAWLRFLRLWTRHHLADAKEKLIFINAWNEWAEGAHLEPDLRWGSAYLDETYKSSFLPKLFAGNISWETLKKERLTVLEEFQSLINADVNENFQNVSNLAFKYKPTSKSVRWLSERLSQFPLLHEFAKRLYKALKILVGRN